MKKYVILLALVIVSVIAVGNWNLYIPADTDEALVGTWTGDDFGITLLSSGTVIYSNETLGRWGVSEGRLFISPHDSADGGALWGVHYTATKYLLTVGGTEVSVLHRGENYRLAMK